MGQYDNMISGYNDIAQIQLYWRISEETSLQPSDPDRFQGFLQELVKLYSLLLGYQARVIGHASKPQYLRAVENVPWKELIGSISALHNSTKDFI